MFYILVCRIQEEQGTEAGVPEGYRIGWTWHRGK